MKRLFIVLLLVIIVAPGSFAAEGNKAGFALPKKFAFKLAHFSNAGWTLGENYTMATFTINNIRTWVLYTEAGELVEANRATTPEKLPLIEKGPFMQKQQGGTSREAVRFKNSPERNSYITAKDEKDSFVPEVKDNRSIQTIKN